MYSDIFESPTEERISILTDGTMKCSRNEYVH